jgi:hypothetical protein
MPRSKGRAGRPWQRLRRQVIDEADDCGRCGKPLDKTLRWPHLMSATAGHIIPLIEGGHPTDRANLQAEHLKCNLEAEQERRRRPKLNPSRKW